MRNVEQLPVSGNMVVGFDENLQFVEGKTHLNPGDTLFLFTDGVNEAVNVGEEEFSYARLAASLEGTAGLMPQQVIRKVAADLASFVGEADQSDDITMLVLKRMGNVE